MVLERHSGVAHEANARGVDSGEVRRPGRVENTKTKNEKQKKGVGMSWAAIGLG